MTSKIPFDVRALAVGVSALVVASVLIGGGGAQTLADGQAQVAPDDDPGLRVLHAAPDTGEVDVAIDGATVLENVSYAVVSDYQSLDPGSHTVTVTEAGNASAVLLEATASLEAGTNYTLAATGDSNTGVVASLYVDNATVPTAGNASVRLLHFSPDAGAVDVTAVPAADGDVATPDAVETETGTAVETEVGTETDVETEIGTETDVETETEVGTETGTEVDTETAAEQPAGEEVVLFDNVSFRQGSAYQTVPAGNYTLFVRNETDGNDGEVLATVEVSLANGTANSALALNYVEPETAPINFPFDVITTEDATVEAVNETTATPGTETATAGTETETEAGTEPGTEVGTETAAPETGTAPATATP